MKIKRIEVSTPQGLSGTLKKASQYSFAYVDENAHEREIGLRYPGERSPFISNTLMPIFTMNYPEGFLADRIRQRMAKTPYNDLFLLALTGRSQIGRLSYHSDEVLTSDNQAQVGLRDILTAQKPNEVFDFLVNEYFASGISGVQPKVLVPDKDIIGKKTITSPSLIVKSGFEEYEGLSQNEFLCMEAARLTGLSVPPFYLSDNGELFVMERFDLEADFRLGFEDMSVILGIDRNESGNYKYQRSYESIAKALKAVCPHDQSQLDSFFSYLCLCVMVRNGDAHLKNFGVLYRDPSSAGERRLSPLYDVTTTSIYGSYDARKMREVFDNTMALKLRSGSRNKEYPTRDDLVMFGKEIIGHNNPIEVIEKIKSAMDQSLRENRDRISKSLFDKIDSAWRVGSSLALNSSMPVKRNRRKTDFSPGQ